MKTENNGKNLKVFLIVAIIALLLIISIWMIFLEKKYTGRVAEDSKKIRIGVITSLSGPAAYFGNEMRNGIELAIKDIEDNEVEIIYEDDKCDPKEGVSSYNRIVNNEGIDIIIGPVCSPVALAVAPLAEEDKVIMITPGAAAKDISESGDYIFRNHVLMTQKTGLSARFASAFYKSAAILYDSSQNAFVDGADAFEREFKTGWNEIVGIESFKSGDKDFKSQLTRIKSKNPEVIYIGGFGSELSIIIKQIEELEINSQIICDDGALDPKVLESIKDSKREIIFSTTEFSEETNPLFWEEYENSFGREPSIFAAQSYDSLMIIVKIIEEGCESGDPTCIKNELYNIQDYQGAAGVTSFDEKGDAVKPLILKKVKNGKVMPYTPLEG